MKNKKIDILIENLEKKFKNLKIPNDDALQRLKEKSSLSNEWLNDAEPSQVGLVIDNDGKLRVTSIYWLKPDGTGCHDDENFFSMSDYVAKLEKFD